MKLIILNLPAWTVLKDKLPSDRMGVLGLVDDEYGKGGGRGYGFGDGFGGDGKGYGNGYGRGYGYRRGHGKGRGYGKGKHDNIKLRRLD